MRIRFEYGSTFGDFMLALGLNWDERDVWRLYFCFGLWYFNICLDRRGPDVLGV
jgi:hypothetical protein